MKLPSLGSAKEWAKKPFHTVGQFLHHHFGHKSHESQDVGSSITSFTAKVAAIAGRLILLIVVLITIVALVVASIYAFVASFALLRRCFKFASTALMRNVRLSNSFEQDSALGLSSETFDLSDNIEAQDTRQGLSAMAKLRILMLMTWYRVGFDEARAMYVQNRFASNNIGPDGRPMDPKAVYYD